jgi:hypothetical protein
MPCKREDYPPPDKRKTPKISSDFIARRQPVRRSGAVNEFISSQLALVSKENIASRLMILHLFIIATVNHKILIK